MVQSPPALIPTNFCTCDASLPARSRDTPQQPRTQRHLHHPALFLFSGWRKGQSKLISMQLYILFLQGGRWALATVLLLLLILTTLCSAASVGVSSKPGKSRRQHSQCSRSRPSLETLNMAVDSQSVATKKNKYFVELCMFLISKYWEGV